MAETVNSAFMSLPAGSEDPSLGDDRIRAFKAAWKERLEKEHFLDLSEAGAQPRQGLHKAGSAVAFYQASAPTQRNGVALGASDAGILWSSTTGKLSVWTGTAWMDATEVYEFINTSKTYSALGWSTYLYLGTSAIINISAGATVAGSRLRIFASSSGGTVKFSASSSPVTLGANTLDVVWNGTTWQYEWSAMPIRLVLVTTAGTANIVVPISGPYTYVLQGAGGAGGGADMAATTGTNALSLGGGGGAGAWQKWRSWIAGGTSLAYICGAGGTGTAGATGGNGAASSWNSKSAAGGSGGVGISGSAYGGYRRDGASGVAVKSGAGLVDFFQPGSPRYFNGTGYQSPITIRYNEPTTYFNYFMAAASGVASKYGPGGVGGYLYGDSATSQYPNSSVAGGNASVPGSGGGGALAYKNTTGRAGGAGADGLVHICLGYEVV